MTFYTFSLPEDRCVRLLIRDQGRRMPESAFREELESLGIQVQGVMQIRSGRRDQDPSKDRPLTPHFIVSVARGPEVPKVRSLTGLCGLRVKVETYVPPKGPLQCKRCQRFCHTQRNCGHGPRCVACGGPHLVADCPAPRVQPRCCGCGGDHTARYRECAKWKEAKAALAGRASERGRWGSAPTSRPAPPKSRQPEPSAEQMVLGEGWSHVVRGGRVVKANSPRLNPPLNRSQRPPNSPK